MDTDEQNSEFSIQFARLTLSHDIDIGWQEQMNW